MNCKELIEWIEAFKIRTYKMPNALYLGRQTLAQLKYDIYANRYMSPPYNHADQEKFNRISIYEVNKDFHIGAGI